VGVRRGSVLFGRPLATYLDVPGFPEMAELTVFGAAVVGSGIGFLWYNTYPAQVFMGDVGSLALGGGLGMFAVITKTELLSVILGGIFFIEAVSVITQVVSFKLFKKRVFLMAPIHHHFEKKGMAGPRIIVRSGSSPSFVPRGAFVVEAQVTMELEGRIRHRPSDSERAESPLRGSAAIGAARCRRERQRRRSASFWPRRGDSTSRVRAGGHLSTSAFDNGTT
jgi:hypothetical protein